MQLVEKHIITNNHKYFNTLDDLLYKSKNLYNATLYAIRQHFFNTGEYLPYGKLQYIFQNDNQFDYRQLPSKVSQWVMKCVDTNFKSFFKGLQEYKKNPNKFKGKPKLPKYLDKTKGRYMLIYTNQAISKRELINNGIIKLSGTDVVIKTKVLYEDLCQVRVIKKINCFVIEVVYNYKEVMPKPDNGKYASIDLGLNNLVIMVSNIDKYVPIGISGRKLKSINHYYNKQVSKYKSILEKKNKVKVSKRIQALTEKRNNRVDDYLHKASRYIVNQLIVSGINTLVIGNNKEWKQDINIGKVNNQNFVQIPHSRLIDMLKYKCEKEGIIVKIQEESYTSKCSFLDCEEICKHEEYIGKRVKRGLYKSGNGRYINADVNGAYNILVKSKHGNYYENNKEVRIGCVVHPRFIANLK